MRKLNTAKNLINTIAAIGDSQTDLITSWGVPPELCWNPVLSQFVNASGGNTCARTFGVSGNTTLQMLHRAHYIFMYDTPKVGVIYGGVNDPVNTITQAQTQAYIQGLIKMLKYGVRGNGQGFNQSAVLNSQTELPINGKIGDRYLVLSDSSSSGGVPANASYNNVTITGNYAGSPVQSVWEFRNVQAGELGWGRIAITGTPAFKDGVDKVIVVSANYLNFSTGGDNYNTNTNTGTQHAPYVAVRQAQQAAASAEGVAYCNLYDFQSKLIYGGAFEGQVLLPETTQGSSSWHAQTNNQHHNAYGHNTVARAIMQTIKQKGWIDELSKY